MFYYEVTYVNKEIDLKLPTQSKTYHFKSDFKCKKGAVAIAVNGDGSLSLVRVIAKIKEENVSEQCKSSKIAKILKVCKDV